jgi:hypothetical protein
MEILDRRSWLRGALEARPTETAPAPASAFCSMERHDPEAWKSDLEQWIAAACRFEDRAFQSVSSLYVAFCEWAVNNKSVPCRRDVFETLLTSIGFLPVNGMVHGLVLVLDLAVLRRAAQ